MMSSPPLAPVLVWVGGAGGRGVTVLGGGVVRAGVDEVGVGVGLDDVRGDGVGVAFTAGAAGRDVAGARVLACPARAMSRCRRAIWARSSALRPPVLASSDCRRANSARCAPFW